MCYAIYNIKDKEVEIILDREFMHIFNNRKSKPIEKLKRTAVMILIEYINHIPHIIFEVRSDKLRHQPGEICLPGGKIDDFESPKEGAIREVMEELNISKEEIHYLGESDYLITPYGMKMNVFVGILKSEGIIENKDEVDHIFKVPLSFFIDNKPLLYNMEIGPVNYEDFPFHLLKSGKDYKFSKGYMKEYFYVYNSYVIWGITAQVIKSFITIIKETHDII